MLCTYKVGLSMKNAERHGGGRGTGQKSDTTSGVGLKRKVDS